MAEQKISVIEKDGVTYRFVDEEMQRNMATLQANVNTLTDRIATEEVRAEAAEQGILDSQVSKEAGKGLSTNDYTDEDKAKVTDLRQYVGCTDTEDGLSGVVPAAEAGDTYKYLSGGGNFVGDATKTTPGTMSAIDKSKLDLIDPDDSVPYSAVLGDSQIVMTYENGKVHTVSFNNDGSITETIVTSAGDRLQMTTRFEDGRIVRS